jgi:hypothetical protein
LGRGVFALNLLHRLFFFRGEKKRKFKKTNTHDNMKRKRNKRRQKQKQKMDVQLEIVKKFIATWCDRQVAPEYKKPGGRAISH